MIGFTEYQVRRFRFIFAQYAEDAIVEQEGMHSRVAANYTGILSSISQADNPLAIGMSVLVLLSLLHFSCNRLP
jgi:hypothetical protein